MSEPTTHARPPLPVRLKVSLLSLPQRTQAVLEYFIAGAGRAAFMPAAEPSADAVIFDHDNPDSRRHWEAFHREFGRPGILLSVIAQDVPGTIWVQKPATPAALIAAAARLAAGDLAAPKSAEPAPKPVTAPPVAAPPVAAPPVAAPPVAAPPVAAPPVATPPVAAPPVAAPPVAAPPVAARIAPAPIVEPPVPPFAKVEPPAPLKKAPPEPATAGAPPEPARPRPPAPAARPRTPPPAPELDHAAVLRYCGDRADMSGASLRNDPGAFFATKSTLLEAASEALRVARKWNSLTLLDTPAGPLVVDATANRAHLGCAADRIAALCAAPLEQPLRVRMLTNRDLARMQEEPGRIVASAPADALVWQIALLTSRGRLPAGTDPSAVIYLKHWPNATRLPQTPEALRVAALFAVRGASPVEAARLLGIPQRFVFACYNGLTALDLVTHDGTQLKRRQRRAHRNRTLFNRLFRWLRGTG